MSSPANKSSRTVQEIQVEYSQLCTRAGHLQYQLSTLNKDLEAINGLLRDLNNEAFAAQQASEAKTKEDASEEASKVVSIKE